MSLESYLPLTVNKHKGLYLPKRLQIGADSKSGIPQTEILKWLDNIPFAKVTSFSMLILGSDNTEHLKYYGLVFSEVSLTSLGGVSLSLFSHPSSDGFFFFYQTTITTFL